MAGNPLPGTSGGLLGLGESMLAGLWALGAELGITQVPPEVFAAALAEFRAAETAFGAGRSGRFDKSRAAIGEMAAVTRWLGVARHVIAARLGNRWSALWLQTGFLTPPTSIPRRTANQLALLEALAAFFTEHPDWEVPAIEVTAARAVALREAVRSAQGTLVEKRVSLGPIRQARNTTRAALVGLMRKTMGILHATLARDDTRWLAFGLQMPGVRTTPGQPQNVRAGRSSPGQIAVSCDAEPLATRYRWRTRAAGGSSAFVLAASTPEPFAFLNAPPGRALEIIVQAVNGEAQGVPSEPVFFADA